MKAPISWILAALLAAVVVTAVVKQNTIGQLRAEHRSLAESGVAPGKQPGLAPVGRTAPAAADDGDNSELLKLRSEVTRLRRQTADLEALRAENRKLSNPAAATNMPASEMPGYLAKAAFRDAGLATPESTVQTFLWSVCQGDTNRFLQCLLGDRDEMRPNDSAEMAEQGKMLAGFRIAGRKEIDPDQSIFDVYVDAPAGSMEGLGGNMMPLLMKRVDNEWKISLDIIMMQQMKDR